LSTSRQITSWLQVVVWLLAPALCAAPAVDAAMRPDFLMDSDPQLEVPQPTAHFSPKLRSLWVEALRRPEADMQRMAAETIARAHVTGVPDLLETVPELERVLANESSHPAARFAAARALIVLDSRSSSDKLFQAAEASELDLRQLVEPALARWEYRPATEVWIKRLDTAGTRRRDLILAIRGLAGVRERSVLPQLLAIAHDQTLDAGLRLEAATAGGQIADSGLEQDAERLAGKTQSLVNPICAVRLLATHTSDRAKQLLVEFAGHAEPAVAAAALSRLNEIDSALALPLAEAAMRNPDAHVRLQGASTYLKHPTADRIAPLSQLLADPHPDVRRAVSEGLLQLAETPELNGPIRAAAVQILAGDRWQGQEQAALLLGTLADQAAANRLVELLESQRPEVMVTAAWALRKVAVPETIPALIDKATRQTERRKQEKTAELDDQVAHVFEALGVLQAADALPLLLEYVPKQHFMGIRSRGAAIWVLGRMKAGTRDVGLEDALDERINDFDDKFPDHTLVKQMSAVALARMNAADRVPMLRGLATNGSLPIQLDVSLRWAVKQLTGEELPPPEPLTASQSTWFLEPLP